MSASTSERARGSGTMTLSSGTRFGPYEIADEIGAGGMV